MHPGHLAWSCTQEDGETLTFTVIPNTSLGNPQNMDGVMVGDEADDHRNTWGLSSGFHHAPTVS